MVLSSRIFAQSLNVTLLDQWHDPSLTSNSSNVRYNDCWGYAHDGREYALAGSTEGTHVFEITKDGRFIAIDSVHGKFSHNSVVHRDIKTYRNYAYSVCDEGVSSLQIFDLSYLPDSLHLAAELPYFGRVHNLFIDSARALMYACIMTPASGGVLQGSLPMQVFSLADPLNPQWLYTGPDDIPEVHDAYVRGSIAYLNCGYDGLRVYDFSNPSDPVYLQNLSAYQDQGYNHQGWMTPDGTIYVFGDETSGKRLKKCTVGSDQLLTVNQRFGTNYQNNSVPHNIMLSNEFAFVAYYNEGLRIYDLRTAIPEEIAFYDTYPQTSQFNMYGAWGVYSELPSGRLLVSDRVNGLFLIDFRRDVFQHPSGHFEIYPNPLASGETLTLRTKDDISTFEVRLYNLQGQLVHEESFADQSFAELSLPLARGSYVLTLTFTDYLDDTIIQQQRVNVH